MKKMIIGALLITLTIAGSSYLLKHSGEYIPSENKNIIFAEYGIAILAILFVSMLWVRLVRGKEEPNTEDK